MPRHVLTIHDFRTVSVEMTLLTLLTVESVRSAENSKEPKLTEALRGIFGFWVEEKKQP